MEDYLLRMEHITKEFAGVRALDDVTFSVRRGEVHALVGENGAGKSTLMKVLCGTYPFKEYSGKLYLNGVEQKYANIKQSEKAGISIIFQELNIVKTMNICENIFLGEEIRKKGIIQWSEQFKKTKDLLLKVKLNESPDTRLTRLGVGKQQLIEIVKALNKNATLIIFDEPSASLTETEVNNLMEIIRELRNEGKTCIYISHKIDEIFQIANTVTVMRDGRIITTQYVRDMTEEKIISYMVGRELTQRFPRNTRKAREVVLELKNWTVREPSNPDATILENINIRARRGEILGLAGLMGAGRTELALSIFGVLKADPKAVMEIDGKKLRIESPDAAIKAGISYVSEDRKRFGLVMGVSVKSNMSLASLEKLTKHWVIRENDEIRQTQGFVENLKIKVHSILENARNLSGGNQQKVILAKWLLTTPKVLILDEPTRGIDVGAKYEIYQIMNSLAEQGVSIIMISSELPEILGMSDRIYVMHEGEISCELSHDDASQEKIMLHAAGRK